MTLRSTALTWSAVFVIALILSPTLHLDVEAPLDDWATGLRFLGRLSGLVGFGAYTVTLVLISRWRWLEDLLGGLPAVYQQHHVLGSIAFLSLLLHPILLTSSRMIPNIAGGAALLFDLKDPVVFSGWVSLLLFMLFMTATFLVKLPYHVWRWTHAFSGCAYFAGVYHTATSFSAGGHWLHGLLLFGSVGLAFYLYYEIWRRLFQRHYDYRLTGVDHLAPNVLSARLDPVGSPMPFAAGQFVYVSFRGLREELRRCGITKEAHPYSVASAPLSPTLELIVKGVGDYTRHLVERVGTGLMAQVEGPYGRLLPRAPDLTSSKQTWIAGGVGITPFLSRVREAQSRGQELHADLHYWVNNRSDGIYVSELEYGATAIPGFRFFLYESAKVGLPSVSVMENAAGAIVKNAPFVICGPHAMRRKLTSELRDRGVKSHLIKTEEFNLK